MTLPDTARRQEQRVCQGEGFAGGERKGEGTKNNLTVWPVALRIGQPYFAFPYLLILATY